MIKYCILLAGSLAAGLAALPSQPATAMETEIAQPVILEGRIVDDLGQPVPGVNVRLYGGFATRWEIGAAVTDDRGIYRFDPVPVGARTQRVMPDGAKAGMNAVGMQISHPSYCAEDRRDWWDFEIPMTPGTYYWDIRLVRGGSLRGTVLSASGHSPMASIDLRVMGTGKNAGITADATTDSTGGFAIDRALPDGAYEIQMNDPAESYAVLKIVKVQAGESTIVDVARNQTLMTD